MLPTAPYSMGTVGPIEPTMLQAEKPVPQGVDLTVGPTVGASGFEPGSLGVWHALGLRELIGHA